MESELEQSLKRADTDLQRRFVRRLREEMARQAFSGNALAQAAKRRGHTISQSTISRLCTGRQDPTLGIIHALAETLGVPDWFLLTERDQVEERIVRPPAYPKNVVKIPSPYPSVMQSSKPAPIGKKRRNTR